MSYPSCTDICRDIVMRLVSLGFKIDDTGPQACDHVQVLQALRQSELVKNENVQKIVAELVQVAKCALADLEGIMPEYNPDKPIWWKTIDELRAAIEKATKSTNHKEKGT